MRCSVSVSACVWASARICRGVKWLCALLSKGTASALFCFARNDFLVVIIRRVHFCGARFLHVFFLSSIPTQFPSTCIPMPFGRNRIIIPTLKMVLIVIVSSGKRMYVCASDVSRVKCVLPVFSLSFIVLLAALAALNFAPNFCAVRSNGCVNSHLRLRSAT